MTGLGFLWRLNVLLPGFALRLQSNLEFTDSPDDTLLPIRTTVLANQLSELLASFHRHQQQQTTPTTPASTQEEQTILAGTAPASAPAQSIFNLPSPPAIVMRKQRLDCSGESGRNLQRQPAYILKPERPKSLNTVESLVADDDEDGEYSTADLASAVSHVGVEERVVFTCEVTPSPSPIQEQVIDASMEYQTL